ncbi:TPA: hypothetical protein ACGO88_000142 [Streptococcus suis]
MLIFKLMKKSPYCYYAFHISRAQEKIATQGDCPFPVSRVQAKKTRQGLDSLAYFQVHEKTVHSCRYAFRIYRAQEKIATQGDCPFPVSRVQAKKTRQGLNSPSNFRAHEKTTRTVIALFTFPERKKKWSTGPLLAFSFSSS